jgi:methylase of polypeptide subunit release factors
VEVRCGDLFAPLADLLPAGTFGAGPTDAPVDSLADLPADLIVCNPPYISTGRLLNERAELLLHEPREAFDGGPYGIAIHQRVIRAAPPFLRPGGWLLFEIGSGQERQVRLLFDRSRSYRDVEEVRDASGSVRVMLARTPLPASQVIGRFDSNLCGPG